MQDPVAERVDLAAGQLGMVGEADQLCPCDQIGCGQDDFQPGGVGLGAVTGQVAQPGGLGLADPVLDAGVLAVAQFQAGELTGMTPGAVSVMNAVTRWPSESVKFSCAPGWGRSLRRINRVPAGQGLMSTRSVASATQAPSRMPPPDSIAGYQHWPWLRTSAASRTRASTA